MEKMLLLIYFSLFFGFGLSNDNCSTSMITYQDLLPLVQEKKVFLIDVREPKELQETGWIPGAINIPLAGFRDALQMSDVQFKEKYGVTKPSLHDGNVVVYCRSGRRVGLALEQVADLCYKLTNYNGSMLDWQAHGGPLQKF